MIDLDNAVENLQRPSVLVVLGLAALFFLGALWWKLKGSKHRAVVSIEKVWVVRMGTHAMSAHADEEDAIQDLVHLANQRKTV